MNTFEIVLDLLKRYPALRNSDKLLLWNVWGTLGLVKNGSITRSDYLSAPSSESITRARRKVVELHPELDATEVSIRNGRRTKAEEKGTFIYRERP